MTSTTVILFISLLLPGAKPHAPPHLSTQVLPLAQCPDQDKVKKDFELLLKQKKVLDFDVTCVDLKKAGADA
jgi:hypothetical protein